MGRRDKAANFTKLNIDDIQIFSDFWSTAMPFSSTVKDFFFPEVLTYEIKVLKYSYFY